LALVYAGVGAGVTLIGLILLAVVWRRARVLRLFPRTRKTLRQSVQLATRHAD